MRFWPWAGNLFPKSTKRRKTLFFCDLVPHTVSLMHLRWSECFFFIKFPFSALSRSYDDTPTKPVPLCCPSFVDQYRRRRRFTASNKILPTSHPLSSFPSTTKQTSKNVRIMTNTDHVTWPLQRQTSANRTTTHTRLSGRQRSARAIARAWCNTSADVWLSLRQ